MASSHRPRLKARRPSRNAALATARSAVVSAAAGTGECLDWEPRTSLRDGSSAHVVPTRTAKHTTEETSCTNLDGNCLFPARAGRLVPITETSLLPQRLAKQGNRQPGPSGTVQGWNVAVVSTSCRVRAEAATLCCARFPFQCTVACYPKFHPRASVRSAHACE
jgi:hypothetical protein